MVSADGSRSLAALAYHREVAGLLERTEPELWGWFSGTGRIEADAADLQAELLRSTYRVDEASHPGIVAAARRKAEALQLEVPVRDPPDRAGVGAQRRGLAATPPRPSTSRSWPAPCSAATPA